MTPCLGLFVLQRALRALLTLWLVVTTVFVILRLSGEPVSLLLSDTATVPEKSANTIHLSYTWPTRLMETVRERIGVPPAREIPAEAANTWLNRVLLGYVLLGLPALPDADGGTGWVGATAYLDSDAAAKGD